MFVPAPVIFVALFVDVTVAFPSEHFRAVWNTPTRHCNEYGIPFNFNKYEIIVNSNQAWIGDKIALFDHDKMGLYPFFTDNKTAVNGGIPQLADFNAHFEQVAEDIMEFIPDTEFNGLAVIDWEPWRPTWERNWDSKKIYQDQSILLVKKRHGNWSEEFIKSVAKFEFENAAKSLMEGTLKLVKELRPNALWGFYGFPRCYNLDEEKCSNEVKEQNDKLQWLFDSSTAVYPSIYVSAGDQFCNISLLKFISARLDEAIRVVMQSSNPYIPIYSYCRYNYSNTQYYLNNVHLQYTIGQSMKKGLSGVILWGDNEDTNNPEACHSLQKYLTLLLGPYVLNTTNLGIQCSKSHCNYHGRCMEQDNASSHDKISKYCHFSKMEKQVLTFSRSDTTKCWCYQGWHGNHCDQK
ncbi:hyaluronidase-1-like [Saccoglossus kowalevskii]|uniref:Hyaluronidase n=1 Tax=Saccoglossus kowalevskii TaxID=10224 RepID=A0ABM0GPC5_SACKO|nr:PREDICTED: hyaluronidase-1-like [Saccoglossus kowalevskii]